MEWQEISNPLHSFYAVLENGHQRYSGSTLITTLDYTLREICTDIELCGCVGCS